MSLDPVGWGKGESASVRASSTPLLLEAHRQILQQILKNAAAPPEVGFWLALCRDGH